MRHIILNVGLMGVRLVLRSEVRVMVVVTLGFGVGLILGGNLKWVEYAQSPPPK
jgi:hypothetical protein